MGGDITETGVMIHYVVAEVDRGQVVIQESIPLTHPDDDSIQHLEERIHKVEHILIIRGTQAALEELASQKS